MLKIFIIKTKVMYPKTFVEKVIILASCIKFIFWSSVSKIYSSNN